LAYTQTQLVNAVYAEIAVSQDAPSTDDVSTITSRLADIVADLAARRITGAITTSAVADALFADLVKVVAERIAPFYGRPTNPEALQAAEARLGQSYRLDRTLWTPFQRAVLERLDALGADTNAMDGTAVAGIVQQVLDSLAARRIVSIVSEAAITSAQFRHVVTLVAARCTPSAVKPEAIAEAEAILREGARLDRSQSLLVRTVLERLEAVGASSDAIDGTAVTAQIQPVLDDLSGRRVTTIANEGSVASAQLPHIVTLVAARCLPKAVPPAEVTAAIDALASLDRLSSTSGLARAVVEQLETWGAGTLAINAAAVSRQIQGHLDNLAARNVIYFADESAISTAGYQAVKRYIAGWLAPKPMADVIAQAEGELRTLSRIGKGTGGKLRIDRALWPVRRFY
jgi:hypothetical protein